MIIKKFQGKTEVEATELAKKELGQNVVVMNVKTVKEKGLFAFLRSPSIEVTVALEEENEKPIILKKEEPLIAKEVIEPKIIEDKNEKELDMHLKKTTDKGLEERLDNLQSFLVETLQKPEEPLNEGEETNLEQEEVFTKLLYNTLIENEIKEEYANQLIDDIGKIAKPNTPIDYLLANIYQKMILKFGTTNGITPAKENPKIIYFIGPTGVGKTTTIAKIASRFKVEQKKKIALMTTDTYRIAAAEQLRTYASILDVPFRVIYTVEEIESAVVGFKEYDYILVDTAGHSHKSAAQKESTKEFINSVNTVCEKEIYLVVSATTKYGDLINIADSYSEITSYKMIFTKLDETATLGNLYNLRIHTGADLSYVTCGQNVPDDMAEFNPQVTVKQLLGGKRHERETLSWIKPNN